MRIIRTFAALAVLLSPSLGFAGPEQTSAGVAAYERRDFGSALDLLQPEALAGDRVAEYHLSLMYLKGNGIGRNGSTAVAWLRKAAEHGHPEAQNYLGALYRRGEHVPQDYAEAMRWHLEAAKQDLENAQYRIALMYLNGQGVPQDEAAAYRWAVIASNGGQPEPNQLRQRLEKKLPLSVAVREQASAEQWRAQNSGSARPDTGSESPKAYTDAEPPVSSPPPPRPQEQTRASEPSAMVALVASHYVTRTLDGEYAVKWDRIVLCAINDVSRQQLQYSLNKANIQPRRLGWLVSTDNKPLPTSSVDQFKMVVTQGNCDAVVVLRQTLDAASPHFREIEWRFGELTNHTQVPLPISKADLASADAQVRERANQAKSELDMADQAYRRGSGDGYLILSRRDKAEAPGKFCTLSSNSSKAVQRVLEEKFEKNGLSSPLVSEAATLEDLFQKMKSGMCFHFIAVPQDAKKVGSAMGRDGFEVALWHIWVPKNDIQRAQQDIAEEIARYKKDETPNASVASSGGGEESELCNLSPECRENMKRSRERDEAYSARLMGRGDQISGNQEPLGRKCYWITLSKDAADYYEFPKTRKYKRESIRGEHLRYKGYPMYYVEIPRKDGGKPMVCAAMYYGEQSGQWWDHYSQDEPESESRPSFLRR